MTVSLTTEIYLKHQLKGSTRSEQVQFLTDKINT